MLILVKWFQGAMWLESIIAVLLLGTSIYADLLQGELFLKNGLTDAESMITILGNRNCQEYDISCNPNSSKDQCNDFQAVGPTDDDLIANNSFGESALHVAAAEGRTDAVKYLLKRGLPVDIRTVDNAGSHYRDTLQTPLHCAAAAGNIDVVNILLQYGANVSAVTESGDTPLHKASLNGQTATVRRLVGHGAEVNAKNVFGASPLSMALVNQRHEVIAVLLQHGALHTPMEGDFEMQLAQVEYGDGYWLHNANCSPFPLLIECAALLVWRGLLH